jgi:hypothetical protein
MPFGIPDEVTPFRGKGEKKRAAGKPSLYAKTQEAGAAPTMVIEQFSE